jgi:ATP-dependent DNA helicase RecG
VHQRLALRDKGHAAGRAMATVFPHQLVMTRTPIPRTLAMAGYADWTVSGIDDCRPGRSRADVALNCGARRPGRTHPRACA